MRRALVSIFGFVAVLPLCLQAAAQDPPSSQARQQQQSLSPAEEKRLEIQRAEAEAAALPRVRLQDIEQMVRFEVQNDMLSARTTLSPVDGEVRVVTPDLPGIVRARVLDMPSVDDPSSGRNFTIIHNDLTQPGSAYAITHLACIAGRTVLARDAESESARSSVQLIQDPPPNPVNPVTPENDPVRLMVQVFDAEGNATVNLRLSAHSFSELRRNHPRELETYLRPILREFRQDGAIFAVDTRIAWQVLGEGYQPDGQTAEKVRKVLADFNSDDFRQREGALEQLHKIGQPAALVLARENRAGYSAEQHAGVDSFLAEYLPLKPEEIERLRGSPEFLLDTLSADDPALRRLALKQLERVTNSRVAFDPHAPPHARAAQLQKLRAQIHPAAATAPATDDESQQLPRTWGGRD